MKLRLINSNLVRKRLFAVLVASVVFFVIYLTFYQTNTVCYFEQEFKDGRTLKSVTENLRLRSLDQPKNIFFHETSCSSDGVVRMNSRQACAVESSGETFDLGPYRIPANLLLLLQR